MIDRQECEKVWILLTEFGLMKELLNMKTTSISIFLYLKDFYLLKNTWKANIKNQK